MTILQIPRRSPPSYRDGYAEDGFDAKYPQLHAGCVGSWSMGLGPTGSTLYDRSGNHNHGTLTNMDPATDWVVDDDGYALDFDGSNDHIVTPTINHNIGTGPFSMSLWINPTTIAGGAWKATAANNPYSPAIYKERSGSTNWLIYWSGGISGTYKDSGSDLVAGLWQHICVVREGTGIRMYQGGIQTPNTATSTGSMANGVHWIGSRSGGGEAGDQKLDDYRFYNRALSPNEIALLARRRNIAYERKPLTIFFPAASTGLRRRALIGS